MTRRLGIDLVPVADVREALAVHGERYLARVYTEREVRECSTARGPDPARLAGRFAAKEAVMKVLRAGREAVPWRAVEVRDEGGALAVALAGRAAELAARAGLGPVRVSVARAGAHASAVAVAEARR